MNFCLAVKNRDLARGNLSLRGRIFRLPVSKLKPSGRSSCLAGGKLSPFE
jgi:hypothetical protein